MDDPSATKPDFNGFMTILEVAAWLRLAENTVYEAVKQKQIPGARKIRGKWRIWGPSVLLWMTSDQAPSPTRRAK